MRPTSVVRRNPRIVFQRVAADGGGVLLHPETEVSYDLNAVGVLVWDLLESPRTVGELAERFCAQFEAEAERAHADVLRFLDELVERELVLPVPSGTEGSPMARD